MDDLEYRLRKLAYEVGNSTNIYWRDKLILRIGEKVTKEMIDGLYKFTESSLEEFLKG